jgi:hypothetical protein
MHSEAPTQPKCPLCWRDTAPENLRKSHFIPKALYYTGDKKLQYATRAAKGIVRKHIKDLLLCYACERLLDESGESEVMLHVVPKALKEFPLNEKLRLSVARESYPDLERFSGIDLDIDMDKFAYFALSLVWRAAVHDWEMPDGNMLPRTNKGNFEPPIREYLLGGAFPPDTAIIVIVCSDAEIRKVWTTPMCEVDENCLTFRFLIRGVLFRVMMGRWLPKSFREACCRSPRKCLFYGSAAHRAPEIMAIFEDVPSTGA